MRDSSTTPPEVSIVVPIYNELENLPDLVERIARGLPFAKDDMKTWYSQGPEGYVDYPTLSQKAA